MTAKAVDINYWVFTIVFAALMLFSAIGGLQPSANSIKILHDGLGYPVYFIQYISFAKLAGTIAILIPQLNKTLKEWAYAGLFFDLAGAAYSGIAASGKFDPMILTLFIWIIPGIVSYHFWKKRNQMQSANKKVAFE